jgi:caffeoyl-CoA O-methyltransferase
MGSPRHKGFGQGSPDLARWAEETFAPEDEVLREIRERCEREGLPPIQVGKMDGLHLEVLARTIGAKKVVEIGTLGGYSGVCLLRGMGEGGVLHTFELEPRNAEVARESFRRAGLPGARVHVGAAREGLREIEGDGPFDLVFVDADKRGYPDYVAWAEEHLRTGGLLLCDNAFAFGHVHDPSWTGEDAAAVAPLREVATRVATNGRWRATMLPTAEGLLLAVRVG